MNKWVYRTQNEKNEWMKGWIKSMNERMNKKKEWVYTMQEGWMDEWMNAPACFHVSVYKWPN